MNNDMPQRSVTVTWALLAATALSWALVIAALVFAWTHYEHVFRAFKVKLPAATIWVLDTGRLVTKFWYVGVLLGLLLFSGIVVLSWKLRHRTVGSLLGWFWFGTLLGVPLLLQLWIWVWLYLPVLH